MTTYFCTDDENCHGYGNSLSNAYNNYKQSWGNVSADDLTFYEAFEIKIEVKLIAVEVIEKSK